MQNKYKTIKEWAIAYRKKGWNVIPLYNNTKNPASNPNLPEYIDEEGKQKRGWIPLQSRQSTDVEFNSWFDDSTITGLGVITGAISGITAIDEDSYKDGGLAFELKSPLLSQTASGGKHHLFKYSKDIEQQGLKQNIFIEIKNDGGFVALPPSKCLNKHGVIGEYKWLSMPKTLDELPTLTIEELKPYRGSNATQRVDLKSKLGAKFGTQHHNLRDIANATLNRFSPNEWESLAYPFIRQKASEFNPPHPIERVEKMIKDCSGFILNNPKESLSLRSDNLTRDTATPLSLSNVGKMRAEDRELEKDSPLTGYPELDDLVKGFLPKHFWTLTGETNVGKTAFACNLAENVRRQNKSVLYVALEPEYKVIDYLASVRLNKKYEDLTDEDITFDDGNIEILTLSEVPTYKDLIEVLKKAKKYDLILIDHIGYFCRPEEQSYLVEQARTIRDLVAVSKELATCIVAIAHPRKPSTTQHNRILNLFDISGAAAFAQDSTEVLALYRPPVDDSDPLCVELSNSGVLLVQKTKAGKNGSVRIEFSSDKALITSKRSPYVTVKEPKEEIEPNEYEETEIEEPFL